MVPTRTSAPLPEDAQSDLRAQIEDALCRGAALISPPDRTAIAHGRCCSLTFPYEARILTEESFGPALCVARFEDEQEAIALANGSSFALSSSVWTQQSCARRAASPPNYPQEAALSMTLFAPLRILTPHSAAIASAATAAITAPKGFALSLG